MTDRTNLDVAAEEAEDAVSGDVILSWREMTKAQLDAIHPALADLTPADVAVIFSYCQAPGFGLTRHAREVLSRD